MQLTCTFVALMAALSQLASASPVPFPSGAAGLPTGTIMLGFDPDAGVAQAYDNEGTLLGNVSTSSLLRRQSTSGTCAALDATQMQTSKPLLRVLISHPNYHSSRMEQARGSCATVLGFRGLDKFVLIHLYFEKKGLTWYSHD
jgi:hypothetical protein